MTYEDFTMKWLPSINMAERGDFTRHLTRLCTDYQLKGYDNGVLQAKHLAHIVEQITEILGYDN